MASITSLFWTLYHLAWNTIKYYLGVGSWNDVVKAYNELANWFGTLDDYINSWAHWAYNSATAYAASIVNTLSSTVSTISSCLTTITNWYNYIRAWINWFYADPVNALRYYIGDA